MKEVNFLSRNVELPSFNTEKITVWIEEVAKAHGRSLGAINYIFCDDNEILRVNLQFLNHDYFTDIITFDYSNRHRIAGDMFISLDTVRTNAQQFNKTYHDELMRVVIHGVLHLCGINDKGPGEREIMEAHEDAALAMLENLTLNQ